MGKNVVIKIPAIITCYYCNKTNFLLIKGNFGYKLVKLPTQILLFIKDNSLLIIDKIVLDSIKFKKNKKFTEIQNKVRTLINKAFLDISWKSYKKLKLYGVGFKIKLLTLKQMDILQLSLGYSHNIYLKIPKDIKVLINSPTRFIISGHSKDRVGEISSQIRKLKIPEPYKGKGILYTNEIINLKEVKKS